MLLKDYIPYIPKRLSKINFSGVAFDSSRVKKNNIFFAIKGKKFDGNDFISHAIKKGATVIFVQLHQCGPAVLRPGVHDPFSWRQLKSSRSGV